MESGKPSGGQGPGPPVGSKGPSSGGGAKGQGSSGSNVAEIPFWIHDKPKWVSGISRQTTCQDILHALVRAERRAAPHGLSDTAAASNSSSRAPKSEKSEELACRKISRQLALVEQWRGVERPLSAQSRILKLWNAWGEEKSQVKFVIKRISSTSSASALASAAVTAIGGSSHSLLASSNNNNNHQVPASSSVLNGHPLHYTSTLPLPDRGRRSKPRRRNSRASACSSLVGRSGSGKPSTDNSLGADDLYKRSETVHPKAFLKKTGKLAGGGGSGLLHDDIERLMRIILTQGETIHSQLRRLREREGQIETFEQTRSALEQRVHDTRTKTAGKDYLLNAYLDSTLSASSSTEDERGTTASQLVGSGGGGSTGSTSVKYKKSTPGGGRNTSSSKQDPSSLSEMVHSLDRICSMNERLTLTEEKINDLSHQIGADFRLLPPPLSTSSPSKHQGASLGGAADAENSASAQRELKELILANDKYGQEIDYNRHLISSMRLAFDERRALMAKLEEDVSSVESEGQQLQQELKSIQESRQKQTLELLHQMERAKRMAELEPPMTPNLPIVEETSDEEDEMPILFADAAFLHSASETPVVGGPHPSDTVRGGLDGPYQISNEQLYDTTVTSGLHPGMPLDHPDPRTLYDELQRRLHVSTGHFPPPSPPGVTRISATGSPGSNSSSGNSSGSGGSAYMEGVNKSVRFSDREQVLATPDLPDVPESKKFHHQRAPNPILKSPQSHSDSHHRHQINGSSSSSNRNSSSVNTVNGAVNGANNPGDTDSNSDTGLSSLHSSSDEGTYVLDTLV